MLFIEIRSLEGGPVWIWLMDNHIEIISFMSLIQLFVKLCGASYSLLPLISIFFPHFYFFSNVLFHFPCDVLFCLSFFLNTAGDENSKRLSSRARKR